MLQNRIVIVTGASRGLGRVMALALAERGAAVIAVARNPEALRKTVAEIRKNSRALAIPTDVRDENQVRNMVRQVLDAYGRIDVLVNNAGMMAGEVAFLDTDPQLWRDVMDTNLWGAFLCCHAVAPVMIQNRSGVIVNISSGAAVRTGFLNIPYGVSKAGLDRLTLGLAAELKDHGTACVSLSPPASATDSVKRLYPNRNVEDWAAPPELSARALCTLLENDAMRYTGKVLSVREYLKSKGLPT